MSRRARPSAGRHLPPLAPTLSAFKPRAEWNRIGASMFLYVNLPGFFRDQIEVKSNKETRTLRIHGRRKLSSQTSASFDETYRVPESCDMNRMQDSFYRGLLSIEMPIVDVTPKPDKKPDEDERTAVVTATATATATATTTATGGPLERKKTEKEEEKLVEEKKAGDEVGQAYQKAKEQEESRLMPPASGSLERKKSEKVVDQKLSEQEDRKPTADGGDQPARDMRIEGKNNMKPEEQGEAGRVTPKGRSEKGIGESGVEELGDSPAKEEEQPAEKEGESLVNVGVAALVIMGFGAYLTLPLLRAFN